MPDTTRCKEVEVSSALDIPDCDICYAEPGIYDTPTTLKCWGNLGENCMKTHGVMTSVTVKRVVRAG